MEMSKLLPTLFHNFDLKFQNTKKVRLVLPNFTLPHVSNDSNNIKQPYKTQESWFAVQHEGYCTVTKREE